MYRLESSDVAMGCPCNSSVSLVKFSSQAVLFLYPNEFGIRTLYAFDLLTHEVHPLLDSNESQDLGQLNLTEQLRRERMRNFSHGIVSYELIELPGAPFDYRIMIPSSDNKILIYDARPSSSADASLLWEALDGSYGSLVDPHMSSYGDKLAFVLEDDLYYANILEGCLSESIYRVTHMGAEQGVACGVAEFIAQEEMDRYRGFW